jgi:GntR family transcriptional regulator
VSHPLLADLNVDFASAVPVYDQIKRSIKQAIARNLLAEKHPLPSIRELATFLRVNPNTVARAYRDLVQEGIINGRAGIGFWLERGTPPDHEKGELVRQEFLRFVERATEMGFSREAIETLVRDFFAEGT